MTLGLVAIAVRSALAVVFLVAGTAKLEDREGFGRSLQDFGLRPKAAAWLRTVVPVAEIAVAATLISWVGAWAALAFLAAFTVAVAYNLSRGRRPDCRCFGRQSRPIGWKTVARNGALMAAALFVLIHGAASTGAIPGWLIVVLVALTAQLLRLTQRVEALEAERAARRSSTPAAPGLRLGDPAPSFALADLTGQVITLAALRQPGVPVLLIFTNPDCGSCRTLLPEVARYQGETITVAVISRGTVEANQQMAAEHGLPRVLLQRSFEVAAAYEALATPSAVLVTPAGAIGSHLRRGPDEVLALLATESPPAEPQPVGIGEPAPAITLPDITGRTTCLSDHRGRDVLVLFWDPGSQFCARMLDDLRAWDASSRNGAPELLVVATGDIDAAAALSLRSPVALDPAFSVARAFGAVGVPSAVLVDAAGNVASAVATGASDIFALAGLRR